MTKFMMTVLAFVTTLSFQAKSDEWDDAISGGDAPQAGIETETEPTADVAPVAKGRTSDDMNEAQFDADYENSEYQQLMRDEAYYRKEAHRSENELRQAQNAYKSLKKKNTALAAKIASAQSRAEKQARLAQAETNKVSRLQDSAKSKEAQIERLKNRVEALKQKRDEARERSQELAQNINQLSREKAQLVAEQKRTERQLAKYRHTNRSLSKKHKKLSREVRKLNARKQARR